ncbi:MAG: hypothetical protein U1A77_16390 [Pirellulales bacterium]
MKSLPTESIQRLHQAGRSFVLAVTGGGATAISWLLSVPGGSRSILEATVPYAPAALDAFLHSRPERYCCERTARLMAMSAYMRARRWSNDSTIPHSPDAASQDVTSPDAKANELSDVIGVGCTASLASDRPKRGAHRAHVALQSATSTTTYTVHFVSNRRSRLEEEQIVSELIIAAMGAAAGLRTPPTASDLALDGPQPLADDESLERLHTDAPAAWQALTLGHLGRVVYTDPARSATTLGIASEPASGDQLAELDEPPVRILFPGAFNPLHDGHREMARVATELTGWRVDFELSIENVDKPPLDYTEIATRGRQFGGGERLWLTRAPTFAEKSRLFPGALFIVGADTIARVGNAKYHGGTAESLQASHAEIARHGCRFLVFGRTLNGPFRTLDSLDLPASLRSLCESVDEQTFRADISSTAIRSSSPPDS